MAIDRYDEVLKVDPGTTPAAYAGGWSLASERPPGAADRLHKGEQSIDRAIAVAPGYADPYCFKAIIRFRFYSDAAGAKGPVDTCVASNPPAAVADLVSNLAGDIAIALAGGTTTGGADYNRAMSVRLGGGQGFYGDGVQPVADVLAAGVDYLVCEALAELTLAILQKDRQRDESLGYTATCLRTFGPRCRTSSTAVPS